MTSPVWADGKIFWMEDKGDLFIVQDAGSSAKLLLTQKICGITGSTPAIAEGRLVVRDYDWGLHCYELRPTINGKNAPAPPRLVPKP